MRFALTDEQQMLRESLRGALARELPPARLRAALERGDAGSAMQALAAAQGWTGIGIDEGAGGQGGGVVEQAILAEELGRAAAPSSALIAGAQAARVLSGGCDDARDVLERLAEGTCPVVVGLDASTGAHGAVAVTAGVADGEAANVLAAPDAAAALILGDDGVVLAGLHDDGCRVRPLNVVDPARSIGDIVLTGAPVRPLGCTAGEAGAGDLGAVLVAAEALGAADRLLEMTVEYVGQREQFGVAIGSFQAVKHTAADMLVALETARSLVHHAAWALGGADAEAAVAVSMAKAYAVPAAASVADAALALHGAVGFTWEHDLHLFLKRTHAARALFGSAGSHHERIAQALDLTGADREPAYA